MSFRRDVINKPSIGVDIYEMLCNDRFMDEMNFDWDDLRLFLAVAQHGGLAAAAEATGKSPPTLGRRMIALERRLGRDLFVRLPRGYSMTDDGEALLVQVTGIAAQMAPVVAVDAALARPIVKVSAGTWVTHLLCQHTRTIIGEPPVRLRFIAAEEVVDIGRREALIGIRNHRPDGPGLAGRRVATVQFATYARSDDVTTWARVIGKTPSAQWVAATAQGHEMIEINTPRHALDLALAGAARVVLPTFIGRQHADLVQLSDTIADLSHDQWLVTHHEDRFVPAVRQVIDRIYTILRGAGGVISRGGPADPL